MTPNGYPRNRHFLALESNLCLWRDRVQAKAKQPKTFKCEWDGDFWYSISKGVEWLVGEIGNLLVKYVAVRTQSLQNLRGNEAWNFKAQATLRMGWCFLSIIKFC